jgi:hypothetical protein
MGRHIILVLTNPLSYAFDIASWHVSSLSYEDSTVSSPHDFGRPLEPLTSVCIAITVRPCLFNRAVHQTIYDAVLTVSMEKDEVKNKLEHGCLMMDNVPSWAGRFE